jgi:hypothetical protein
MFEPNNPVNFSATGTAVTSRPCEIHPGDSASDETRIYANRKTTRLIFDRLSTCRKHPEYAICLSHPILASRVKPWQSKCAAIILPTLKFDVTTQLEFYNPNI